jgi:signal transduction histidine kinase
MDSGARTEPDGPAQADQELFERLVHDLRNPLGVIAYFAEALPGAEAAERDDLYERLRLNAQRALQVLEELSLLAGLRAGRAEPDRDACDVGQLIEALAFELESMERRPGRIHRRIEVRGTRPLPRAHLACALRAVLRAALRATAPDDALDIEVREQGRQIVFKLTVPLPADVAGGGTPRILSGGDDVEIMERVGALYRGHCALERLADREMVTFTLPVPPR